MHIIHDTQECADYCVQNQSQHLLRSARAERFTDNKIIILNQHERYALDCVEVGRVSGRQDNNQSSFVFKKEKANCCFVKVETVKLEWKLSGWQL